MPKRINNKVIEARVVLKDALIKLLAEQYSLLMQDCSTYGYRMQPELDNLNGCNGWFAIIDGSGETVAYATPLQVLWEAKAEELSRELSLVKHISAAKAHPELYLPDIFTDWLIQKQQACLAIAEEAESNIARINAEIQKLRAKYHAEKLKLEKEKQEWLAKL